MDPNADMNKVQSCLLEEGKDDDEEGVLTIK